jgi:hypothetical protein
MLDDLDLRHQQLEQQRLEQQRQETLRAVEPQRAEQAALEAQREELWRREQEARAMADDDLMADEARDRRGKASLLGGLLGWFGHGAGRAADEARAGDAAPVGQGPVRADDRRVPEGDVSNTRVSPADAVPPELAGAAWVPLSAPGTAEPPGRAQGLPLAEGQKGEGHLRRIRSIALASAAVLGGLALWQVWGSDAPPRGAGGGFSLGPAGAPAMAAAPPVAVAADVAPMPLPAEVGVTPAAPATVSAALAAPTEAAGLTPSQPEQGEVDTAAVEAANASGPSVSAGTQAPARASTTGVEQQLQRLEAAVAELQAQLAARSVPVAAGPEPMPSAQLHPPGGTARPPVPTPRPARAVPTRPPGGVDPSRAGQGSWGGQLLAVDLWAGQPSVVVGTGLPGDGRTRVLRPGEQFNGVALLSADPAAGTATFQVQGGRPFTLSLKAGG